MATIYLQLYEKKTNHLAYNVPIVGRTMTKSWIHKHYGKDTNILNMWLCHKNPYGIKWIITSESRYGGVTWDCVTDGIAEKKFPAGSFSYRLQGYLG